LVVSTRNSEKRRKNQKPYHLKAYALNDVYRKEYNITAKAEMNRKRRLDESLGPNRPPAHANSWQ
jgi:hypothetical protein